MNELTEYEKARLELFKIVYDIKQRHSKNERLYQIIGYVLLGVAIGIISLFLILSIQFNNLLGLIH